MSQELDTAIAVIGIRASTTSPVCPREPTRSGHPGMSQMGPTTEAGFTGERLPAVTVLKYPRAALRNYSNRQTIVLQWLPGARQILNRTAPLWLRRN